MSSVRVSAFVFGALLLANPLTGQDGKKPADPKRDDPPAKYRGTLPQNWKKLGLTDDQTQKVYKIQAKYNEQIDKLEEQIRDLKAEMYKKRGEVLTAEQKKRLEELNKAKVGG